MDNLPTYISIVFGLTTFLTVWLFYKAANNSRTFFIIIMAWLALQAVIGISGFYVITTAVPPRFPLLVLPPFLLILWLFITSSGRKFVDSLDVKTLTLLHTIRIPVEIVLLWLSMYQMIPVLMTFEGRNFDIISGLTAPIVFYYGYIKQKLSRNILLLWNFVCLGLLVNIVTNAVLSVQTPFQKFAFDQPNIGILHFPFVWLPCCVVPIVLLSHLATIRQLLLEKKNSLS
ncbi:MAG: hypothetical protein HYZ42_04800 [Bacteroidetes bacterium]|nr:hypothetical protein [Bacteroidota bacterium]